MIPPPTMREPRATPHAGRHNGFSLIELLTVLAALGILASVSIVAFSGIGRSQRVNEAVSAMDDAFSLSFHHARSRGLPVWLAVTTENPGTPNERIRIRKYTTKDGGQAVGQSDGQATQLIQLSRDRVIPQVRLTERSGNTLRDAIGNPPVAAQLALGPEGGWIFINPGGEVRATAGTPDFNNAPSFPQGSMLRDVEIAVTLSSGASEQIALVQFSGLTGASRVFRP